jgi:hypothetical protein
VLKCGAAGKEEKLTRFIGITGHANPAAMQAALERHDFGLRADGLNVARARMKFDGQGAAPGPRWPIRATRRSRFPWRSARRWV